MVNPLPTLFIGSSTEALFIARAGKAILSTVAKVTLWDDTDAYQTPGSYFLDALVRASTEHDFALLVFAADDKLLVRD